MEFAVSWMAVQVIWQIVVSIVALGAAIYSWRARNMAADKDLAQKIAVLETRINSGATRESLSKLSLAVTEIEGDTKVVGARLDGIEQVMNRIEKVVNRQEDFLLNRRGQVE